MCKSKPACLAFAKDLSKSHVKENEAEYRLRFLSFFRALNNFRKMTSITSDEASGMSKLSVNNTGNANSRTSVSAASNFSKKSDSELSGSADSSVPEPFVEPLSPRTLEVIDEDRISGDEEEASPSPSSSQQLQQQQQQQQQQQHRSKRANMVKKALTYFSDKSNRSVSEDNLFTR